ncbi:MAG: Lrp/AsnC family transcriptional regulator [Alphaproteobacteria bacterium]|jgi:DNA-binding Lrp family transcriptional regulator|nr:Lrp/AsnC family transcriptional regulator [Alphaproteobacteria bacterium]
MTVLSEEERRLLDGYQRDFPLLQQPFAVIAAELGMPEGEVIESCRRLRDAGVINRIGATVAPHRNGWSTLAAMAVPPERLEDVAALVSARPEVNHNYERENEINLWFVVTAARREDVAGVLDDIARECGLEVLDLPLEEPFRLDLGFPLQWS